MDMFPVRLQGARYSASNVWATSLDQFSNFFSTWTVIGWTMDYLYSLNLD